MIHRRFTLQSALGQPIHGDLRLPEGNGPHPVVVVCHGFKGFKDWGFHPWLGERLAAAGLAAVHFNFSETAFGCRTATSRISTPSARTRSPSSATTSTRSSMPSSQGGWIPRSTRPGSASMGHSRGGGIALLGASERPEVKALATWAAVSHFDRIADEATLAEWRRTGVYEVVNARTGQILPMGLGFLDDILGNRSRLGLLSAARRLASGWLVVHGSADETVPFAEAEELVAAAGGPARLAAIDGAGHTFGAVHPFAGPTPHLEEAATATLEHFQRALTVASPAW